tara:strand:+ start:13030 stop:14001 length:972 start_codon:yes stop_codon:yes gene_type:complete
MSVDDTFNFNLLLAKALTDEKSDDNNICLISNEPLNEKHIKLDCSHCFNYGPLYYEIVIQKTKINPLETQKIDKYSIKCPYCRYTQKGILPIRHGFKLVKYVNYPTEYVMKTNKCSYVFLSGKKKNQVCNKSCHKTYCIQHAKIMEKRLLKHKTIQKSKIKEIQPQLSSFFDMNKTCKRVDTHPVISLNNFKFTHLCQHKFTKGKNKGNFCNNKMNCTGYSTDLNKSYPKYYEKYFCKTHAKSKKNKNAIIEIVCPDIVFIFDSSNNYIKDKDLIDKYYSKYSQSDHYEFIPSDSYNPSYFAFKKDNDKICPQENQIISSVSI